MALTSIVVHCPEMAFMVPLSICVLYFSCALAKKTFFVDFFQQQRLGGVKGDALDRSSLQRCLESQQGAVLEKIQVKSLNPGASSVCITLSCNENLEDLNDDVNTVLVVIACI